MSEAKFTPGPWEVEDNPTIPEKKQVASFEVSGSRCLQVVVRTHNEFDYNLIAAAPDMYEALQELHTAYCELMNEKDGVAVDAAFALAKALDEL